MNGNVPLFLHASVPPLRQAPCYGYSINHSIKQSNIQRVTFLPMPNLPLLHSHARKRTHTHTRWRGKTKRSIRAHCVSANHGTMEGIGMEKCPFLFTPPIAAVLATISQMLPCLTTQNNMHAHENLIPLQGKRKRSLGAFCRFRAEGDKKNS